MDKTKIIPSIINTSDTKFCTDIKRKMGNNKNLDLMNIQKFEASPIPDESPIANNMKIPEMTAVKVNPSRYNEVNEDENVLETPKNEINLIRQNIDFDVFKEQSEDQNKLYTPAKSKFTYFDMKNVSKSFESSDEKISTQKLAKVFNDPSNLDTSNEDITNTPTQVQSRNLIISNKPSDEQFESYKQK